MKYSHFLLVTTLGLACWGAQAVEPAPTVDLFAPSPSSSNTTFDEQLLRKYPSTQGSKTAPAFQGFHSVVKGSEVIFISDDLSILIKGDVIQLKDGVSLTAALNASLTEASIQANKPLIDISKLDLNDAIAFGKGSKAIYVFSDPDCPFCKQLEPELSKLADTRVYIFPFPLTSLHPNSKVISQAIWCSPNRAKAWRDYVSKGVMPKSASSSVLSSALSTALPIASSSSCSTPIERNLALGQSMQIQGTPSIIFPDGSIIPGAVSAERIAATLDSLQAVKVGASK